MERLKQLNPELKIKIGQTSITIQDNNNKTKGIIKHIQLYKNMEFNKKFDVSMDFRKKGLMGKLEMDKLVFDNNNIYYLVNSTSVEEFEKDVKEYNADHLMQDLEDRKNQLKMEIETCNNNNIEILDIRYRL